MTLKFMGALVAVLTLASAFLVVSPRSANATPAFASQTGKACGACHANPSGGGKLTAAGEKFKASKK